MKDRVMHFPSSNNASCQYAIFRNNPRKLAYKTMTLTSNRPKYIKRLDFR